MIVFVYYYISIFSIICGVITLVRNRKHFLSTLLRLEFIIINIFWLIVIRFFRVGVEGYFVLFFLTLAACEGALGLRLLVYIVRSRGADYYSSFNIL